MSAYNLIPLQPGPSRRSSVPLTIISLVIHTDHASFRVDASWVLLYHQVYAGNTVRSLFSKTVDSRDEPQSHGWAFEKLSGFAILE